MHASHIRRSAFSIGTPVVYLHRIVHELKLKTRTTIVLVRCLRVCDEQFVDERQLPIAHMAGLTRQLLRHSKLDLFLSEHCLI